MKISSYYVTPPIRSEIQCYTANTHSYTVNTVFTTQYLPAMIHLPYEKIHSNYNITKSALELNELLQ